MFSHLKRSLTDIHTQHPPGPKQQRSHDEEALSPSGKYMNPQSLGLQCMDIISEMTSESGEHQNLSNLMKKYFIFVRSLKSVRAQTRLRMK